MAEHTLRRHTPKVGAVCGKSACTVLCGGRSAMSVPTAIASLAMTKAAALHHHAQPLRRTRDAGVEPAGAAVLERKAFIEQHHVVPLRALRLVHGQHIAVVELVIRLALFPRDAIDPALEAILAHRDFCDL